LPAVRYLPLVADLAWLALACAVAAVVSLAQGQDANWDLANYHLYNPWAWLNGRYGFDLAPAQVQTFHNPLVDVPFYAMVAADWHPRAIAVALALPAGIAAFALGKTVPLLFRDCDASVRRVAIAAALLIGLTGTAGIGTIGNTMNEWPNAALVSVAIWRLVHGIADGALRMRTIVFAGLVIGIACGLKLTAAASAVALSAALLARMPVTVGLRDAIVFGALVLGGLAISAGAWMAMLNELYGSPLFPYFNEIFRAPLLPPEPVLERRFGPKSVLGWLAFPFTLLQPERGYVMEAFYRDPRFPVLAALALVAVAIRFAAPSRFAGAAASATSRAARRFVAVYLGAGFVTWAIVHSYYRYLLPLELLTGAGIVALALRLVRSKAPRAALVALAVAIVAATDQPDWGRVAYGERFLEVNVPPIERGALVLLTYDAPMAYVLTRFPADARHVGIHNNLVRADRRTALRDRVAHIIAGHRGRIYQLTPMHEPSERVLEAYGLKRVGRCEEIRSNLDREVLHLCPLERAGG
jgi:hypothetical protein